VIKSGLIDYSRNDNPAREWLLARRVYVIGSKAVWLIEEIPAREFYWPAECTCAIIRLYWPVKQ